MTTDRVTVIIGECHTVIVDPRRAFIAVAFASPLSSGRVGLKNLTSPSVENGQLKIFRCAALLTQVKTIVEAVIIRCDDVGIAQVARTTAIVE